MNKLDEIVMPIAEPARIAPRAFHIMLKPRGAICNQGCAYCYCPSLITTVSLTTVNGIDITTKRPLASH